jgi:hypothetical protein
MCGQLVSHPHYSTSYFVALCDLVPLWYSSFVKIPPATSYKLRKPSA